MDYVRRGMNFRPQVRKVPRNGWTPERERIFFQHLGATCNVKLSAAKAGPSAGTAYYRRQINPVFRERWRQALEEGYVRIETMLIARTIEIDDAQALAREAAAEAEGDAGAHLELTEGLDTQLAMQLLCANRKVVHGGYRPGGRRPGPAASEAELADAIEKQLSAFNRRRGGVE